MPFLSVIIPAYNEERRIFKILEAAEDYLVGQNFDYEIIVVNDGSEDKTVEVAKSHSSGFKNFLIIDNKNNQGKGAAVKQGMLAAKGDFRLFADADNSTPFEEFEKFIPFLQENYEVVFASRALKDSQVEKPQNFLKVFLGRLGNLLIRKILKLNITDTQCGFKCFKAMAAQEIFSQQKISGWSFDAEILVLAKKLGFKFKEVPVRWINEKSSRVSWKSYFLALKDIWKIRNYY